MRIILIAVGRVRAGPAKELYADYVGRLRWPMELREVEERRKLSLAELKFRESELILKALPPDAWLVALDERGKSLDSRGFADLLGRRQEAGQRDLAFAIGGAEGLGPAVLERADFTLSLGPMTWPHMLVRALIAEQLFRAQSILAGHPYHRD